MITQAVYDRLANDLTLAALLNSYDGAPAVFTTDPAPGNALLPYIVSAGDVSNAPFDTKTSRGNTIFRDVRCYDSVTGTAVRVEQMARRVRELFHRQVLVIAGFVWIWAECSGPVAADEDDAYGRIVTVKMTIEEV